MKRNIPGLILLVITLVSSGIWLLIDRAPPSWDPAFHLLNSLRFSEKETFLSVLLSDPYPPLFRIVNLPLSLIAADADSFTFYSTSLSLLVMVLSITGISRLISPSLHPIYPLLLLLLFPLLSGMIRSFWIDVPLTAALSLFLYTLFLFSRHPSRRYALFLGLTLAGGGLVKWSFFVFAAAPLIVTLIKRWKEIRAFLLHLFLPFLLILLPWYGWRAPSLFRFALWNYGMGGVEGDPPFHTLEGILYYIKVIPYMASPLLLLPVLLGLVTMIWKRAEFTTLILSSILFPYLVFTFIHNKDPRYLLPLAPVLSIAGGYGAAWHGRRWWGRGAIPLLLLLSILQNISLHWTAGNFPLYPYPRHYYLSSMMGVNIPDPFIPYPVRSDWRVEETAAFLMEESPDTPLILILGNSIFFNDNTLSFELFRRGWRGEAARYYPGRGYEDRLDMMRGETLIILYGKTYLEDNLDDHDLKDIARMRDHVMNGKEYALIFRRGLPDGSDILLYRDQSDSNSVVNSKSLE